MDNEKRYIVEQIAAKLMKSCTIHDSGLFICTLNKELDKYHQNELLKLNKSDVSNRGGAIPFESLSDSFKESINSIENNLNK